MVYQKFKIRGLKCQFLVDKKLRMGGLKEQYFYFEISQVLVMSSFDSHFQFGKKHLF